jgi:hypothetical protein
MVRLGRVTLIALVAALASCGSSAARPSTVAPPPRHPPACGPAQASTLAFSAQARVYERSGVVYGCSVPSGRSFPLGTQAFVRHRHLAGIYAVGGTFVAYAEVSFGVDNSITSVLVRRLSDGALLGSYPATNTVFAEGFSSVGSLVVASRGAAAWIGQATAIGRSGPAIEVLAASPSAANTRSLDSGSTIAPKSLRLQGATLSWRHGGSTRHATLP